MGMSLYSCKGKNFWFKIPLTGITIILLFSFLMSARGLLAGNCAERETPGIIIGMHHLHAFVCHIYYSLLIKKCTGII
jgi:hypothetical protein